MPVINGDDGQEVLSNVFLATELVSVVGGPFNRLNNDGLTLILIIGGNRDIRVDRHGQAFPILFSTIYPTN
jgi:hypothetical protein